MQGETESLPQINEPVANALEYRFLTDELITLKHPVGEDIGDGLLLMAKYGHGSLVPDFCRKYVEITGKNVVAVHTARGGTQLSEWLKGTERFESAVNKIKSAIKKAEKDWEIENVYIIWLQGESDAINKTTKEEYKQMLTNFKNDLKEEFKFNKFCIIGVGYFCGVVNWVDCGKVAGKLQDEVIMAAQEEICKEDEDFLFLTDICKELSLNEKNLNPFAQGHYNNESMKIIGETAAESLAYNYILFSPKSEQLLGFFLYLF